MGTTTTAPIKVERRVGVPPDRAFEVFFHGIDGWWPLATHSVHGERGKVVVEPGPDGRIVEHAANGDQIEWARIETWDPPGRLVLRWHPNPERSSDTEVEIRLPSATAMGRWWSWSTAAGIGSGRRAQRSGASTRSAGRQFSIDSRISWGRRSRASL